MDDLGELGNFRLNKRPVKHGSNQSQRTKRERSSQKAHDNMRVETTQRELPPAQSGDGLATTEIYGQQVAPSTHPLPLSASSFLCSAYFGANMENAQDILGTQGDVASGACASAGVEETLVPRDNDETILRGSAADDELMPAHQVSGTAPTEDTTTPGGVDGDPFNTVKDAMFSSCLGALEYTATIHDQMVDMERKRQQDQLDNPKCQCPNCNSCGPHNKVQGRGLLVWVVTLLVPFLLTVPELRCNNCGHFFHPKPTSLGFIPGTANGFSLVRTYDVQPLWFPISMLSFIEDLLYFGRGRLSLHHLTQAMVHYWGTASPFLGTQQRKKDNAAFEGKQTPCHINTLRQQLSDALREYGYIASRLLQTAEEIPGWPVHKQVPCAACGTNIHSLHFDAVFKLALFRKARYALSYLAPPNRKLFVDNKLVLSFLGTMAQIYKKKGNNNSKSLAQDEGGCSDFKADKLMSLDSQKFLNTAVAMAVCRHGHIFSMVNLTGG